MSLNKLDVAAVGIREPATVSVKSFNDLFSDIEWLLAVDTYQRGFVWGEDKVSQLLEDLRDYQKQPDPKPPYYMGAILLHRSEEKQKRFVIDGQQRLTALCVLYNTLNQRVPDACALSYSPQSGRRIQTAARVCADWPGLIDPAIFDQIVFTVISVDELDLAFTFFDTQNNRGVPLHATDLLKAYHLRAVGGDTEAQKENLQTQCARHWEALQRESLPLSHPQELVQTLFVRYVWRARRWTGQQAYEGGHDALLREFQTHSLKSEGAANTIPLYRARSNRRALALSLKVDGHSELHAAPISLSPQAEELPFSIRQPVHRGIGFFLYANKYAALMRWLMLVPTEDQQVKSYRRVFDTMVKANSLYLQEVFLLASLVYVDQFGNDRLLAFSLWLENALGALRMEKQQVRQETAQKFFRDDEVKNLLDVISGAFRPEEVIAHLQAGLSDAYVSEKVDVSQGGVQAAYKQAVLNYFGEQTDTLRDKRKWIERRLIEVPA